MNKKELWLNIANYHFENLAPTHLWDHIASQFGGHNAFTKAFAEKLSKKLGWDIEFAMRAIWEYKKFVFLGVISEFSVTPSKIIDQVWHEHLLFSAGYRKFCKDVIHYDFDHSPELVALESQLEAFQSQYYHTIELYKKEFEANPPREIWEETKFTGNTETLRKPKKYQVDNFGGSYTYSESESVVSMFPSTTASDVEFGSGDFGGAGSGSNWSEASDSSSSGDSDSGSDSGSSCSSSCGGCGGGD